MTLNVLSAAGSTGSTGITTVPGFSSHLDGASDPPEGATEFQDIAEPMTQERRI
jgi:hypothetical protein